MKKIVFAFLILVMIFPITSFGQEKDQTMEKRAKGIHEALKSADKKVWENFIKENYSDKLLEKYPVSKHIDMFQRLHTDFGDSKILSLKPSDTKFLMVVERKSDGHRVTFELISAKDKPYKIDGFGIEAGEIEN